MADVLRSELLRDHGVVHGFSLRTGGVGAPPYDTLNLGRNVGDDPAAVAENHRLLARAVGYPPERLFEVGQVHRAEVVPLPPVGPGDVDDVRRREADALVATADPAGPRAVGVRTADCVPVLAAHPAGGTVAAIHVGWRGAVAGVLPRGLEALVAAAGSGVGMADLVVALGPHIRRDAFEVGPDVADALARAAGPDARVVHEGSGRPRVDLAEVCRAQLAAIGVPRARVDDVGGCTVAEPARFFSHRRDAGRTGRHLAVIVAPAAP